MHGVSRSWNSPVLLPSEPRSHSNCVAEGHKGTAVRVRSVEVCASLVSVHACRTALKLNREIKH